MATNDKSLESEITPEEVFLNRRNFIRIGIFAGSVALTTLAYRSFSPSWNSATSETSTDPTLTTGVPIDGEKLTPYKDIAGYNNFYEFSTDKYSVAEEAKALVTRPWTVEVGGLVNKPAKFDLDAIVKFPVEERIYRFRCVEAWSMVIPWQGVMLKNILEKVEPLGTAKYVAFQSFYDPTIMQSSWSAGIDFPYVEGLRIDEAMHPLTLLATGIYGKPMPNQNGAPLRLVVPWKYGFKSIKSVVKITLTDKEPPTTWNLSAPKEYGFYSNVNPKVDHPRWSQAKERRIGESGNRDTLMFNGYADEVASLYSGMDLKKFF